MPEFPDEIDRDLSFLVRDLSRARRRDLRDHVNVLGTAVGVQEIGGQPTGEAALVVYVDRKRPESELDPADILPKTVETEAGEIAPLDVKEIGGGAQGESAGPVVSPGRPSPARRRRISPTPGGVAIARKDVQAGTCSGLFYDSDGRPVMLTALHVLSPDGSYGADVVGAPVIQPAEWMSTNYAQIGTVRETSDYRVNSTRRATTDIAIVEVSEGTMHPTYLGYRHASGTGATKFNRRVINFNYNTGTVSGTLLERDVNIFITHHWGTGVEMEGLEAYERLSEGGSSGAMVGHIDPETREFTITGMHIGWAPGRSLMIPWSAIEKEFGTLTPATS